MGLNWVFYKLREWVWTETGKGDRLGGRQLGRSEPAFRVASTTALPSPTSIEQGKRPANFTCRLCFATRPVPVVSSAVCFTARPVPVIHLPAVLLQGLCRSFHLPAVVTTRPVPVSFTTGPFCYNGLVLPCHALSACLLP